MAGWIKLYRKLIENPIFQKPDLLQLFIYCLIKANHKPGKAFLGANEIDINRGQFVTGRFELSSALKQKDITTYKRLNKLKSLGLLELKSNNKNTLVTIVNYELYQSEEENITTKEQQSNNKVTTKEQQSNTNKNNKNEKNDKNEKKNIYAEFVTMNENEYGKLINEYGEIQTRRMIETLNNYKGSTGKKYKSDYLAILNWVVEKVTKQQHQEKVKSNNPFLDMLRSEGYESKASN